MYFAIPAQLRSVGAEPSDFNFVAAGDWGCTTETERNVAAIIAVHPELVLALGDFSYESQSRCWIDKIAPIINETRIAIGNHDTESASLLKDYMHRFGLEKQYYSFNYGRIHFLSMSTEVPYDIGSEQYEYVVSDLENVAANASSVWKIVYFHKPMFTSPSNHDPLTDFRNIYHPLFDKYNIDLVLQAHNHNYQRSYPLTFNSEDPSDPIITSTISSTYDNYDGEVYMVIGTGGESLYNLDGKEPYIAVQMEAFGFANFEIGDDGRTLKCTFLTSDGTAKDTFKLQKADASTPEFPVALAIPSILVGVLAAVVGMSRMQKNRS